MTTGQPRDAPTLQGISYTQEGAQPYLLTRQSATINAILQAKQYEWQNADGLAYAFITGGGLLMITQELQQALDLPAWRLMVRVLLAYTNLNDKTAAIDLASLSEITGITRRRWYKLIDRTATALVNLLYATDAETAPAKLFESVKVQRRQIVATVTPQLLDLLQVASLCPYVAVKQVRSLPAFLVLDRLCTSQYINFERKTAGTVNLAKVQTFTKYHASRQKGQITKQLQTLPIPVKIPDLKPSKFATATVRANFPDYPENWVKRNRKGHKLNRSKN